MKQTSLRLCGLEIPVLCLDTLVIGSGCAGLNAADWLYDLGRRDFALLTEGVNMGTSRNTGSDKQTYYKLPLASDETDSVRQMAQTLFSGGGVNGDTALIEAACSVKSFMKLVMLGVPFPTNRFGEYVGYKTDHDPRQRATSAGPLTSKYMTECLERSVRKKGISILDGMQVIYLLAEENQVHGVLCLNLNRLTEKAHGLTLFLCNQVILATGGPAGVYSNSVYPESQTGSTGLALEAGATAANLHQWQYGLSSVDFRWNVSGTYQQVLPRYVAVDAQGHEREFLVDYFDSPQEALNRVFLKGYQWPFDVRKVQDSSLIDIIVHHEAYDLGHQIYLDFRKDPIGLENGFDGLSTEAFHYLANSEALLSTPIARLAKMNPKAIELYAAHGIDLSKQMLRINVCAQHHNGGLAVDMNWQTTVNGLYAVGEAAGTFGTYRPGGSALNATQVGSMRAAEHIAYTTDEQEPSLALSERERNGIRECVERVLQAVKEPGVSNVLAQRQEMQSKMSDCAAHIRIPPVMDKVYGTLENALRSFWQNSRLSGPSELGQMFKTHELLLTQLAVLQAIRLAAEAVGSQGAGLVLDQAGETVLPTLPSFAFRPTQARYEDQILQTRWNGESFESRFVPVRPMPEGEDWFETVWSAYTERTKRVFQ